MAFTKGTEQEVEFLVDALALRAGMRVLERAKRAILPRISSWPNPEPRGLNRINAALTGDRRRRSRQA
jgi:hypothetical protein